MICEVGSILVSVLPDQDRWNDAMVTVEHLDPECISLDALAVPIVLNPIPDENGNLDPAIYVIGKEYVLAVIAARHGSHTTVSFTPTALASDKLAEHIALTDMMRAQFGTGNVELLAVNCLTGEYFDYRLPMSDTLIDPFLRRVIAAQSREITDIYVNLSHSQN